MTWTDLVTEAYKERPRSAVSSFPRFEPGATEAQLRDAERSLGRPLPESLRMFLSECNGVMDVMELEGRSIETGWLMWAVNEIADGYSDRARDPLGPPGKWLVFANAGTDGILFAYDRGDTNGHIWAWHPVGRRRQHMAESLQAFLRGWVIGELSV